MPFTTQATADYGRTDDVGAKFRQSEKDDWKAAPAPEILDDTAFFACAADNSLSFGINDGGDNDDGCRNGCRIDGSSSSSSSSLSSSSSNSNGTVVCPSSSTSVSSVEASSSPSPSPSSHPSSRHDKSSTTSHAAPVNQQASALGADHSGSNSVSAQEEQSSQKNPFYIGDGFNNHDEWQLVRNTAKEFSKGCEYFTGDVLPGDSHARDSSEIKVVCIHGFPVPGLERIMQKNVTKDGLENKSLDQPFQNIVTRLKEDDGYGMSHDNAVDLAFGHIAFIDAIAAVGDWDLRSDTRKKKHFKKLTEDFGLRELMRVIITDVLRMLPNLERIYAMGAEGYIMLDSIRSEFPDKITQEEMILHGMQLSNGWANEDQATRYLDMIDDIASILSREDAKGFKNLEHMRKYVTIGKDGNVRYSIHSIDDKIPLGIAQSLSMIAKWTLTDIETIRRSLKRNDGILSLHGEELYRLTIVSNDVAVGKTDEGVVAFERRRQEVYGTNSREQEVISILSIEGSTPLGTTLSLATAAKWTGVSVDTFRICLNSDDGILSSRKKQLYRISKGKDKVNDDDDEVSFGMTVAGVAAFERRKQEVNAAKQKVISIFSIEGSTPLGTTNSFTTAAEWTGVSESSIRDCLQRNDGILSLHSKPLYRISKGKDKVNDDDDEVSFGMTVAGVTAFERRKQEVKAARKEVISIFSIENSTPLGTTNSFTTAAKWTGVSESSIRDCLKRNDNDGILSLYRRRLYRISKGKVTDDDVSFGMTEAGVAAFECRKQEMNGSARVDQKPLAKKRKLETKTKDPNTQKKSAFLHYASYAGNYIKTRNQAMKDDEIRMYVSRGWNEMTPPQRAYWDTKAKQAVREARLAQEILALESEQQRRESVEKKNAERKQQRLEKRREYRAVNRDRINERQQQRYETNKEKKARAEAERARAEAELILKKADAALTQYKQCKEAGKLERLTNADMKSLLAYIVPLRPVDGHDKPSKYTSGKLMKNALVFHRAEAFIAKRIV